MKDNQGFSLIELIVVMMIIGVLSVASLFGANALGLGSAKSSVGRISSMLDYVQVENMTKSKTFYMIIEKRNNSYILSVRKGTDPDPISSEILELKRGEITFRTEGNITDYLISDVPVEGRTVRDRLEVSFIKDTGSVRGPEAVTLIKVSAAGTSYSIRLVTATGNHYIE